LKVIVGVCQWRHIFYERHRFAATYAELGLMAEARSTVKKMLEANPTITLGETNGLKGKQTYPGHWLQRPRLTHSAHCVAPLGTAMEGGVFRTLDLLCSGPVLLAV
jgi:hypothetical protein